MMEAVNDPERRWSAEESARGLVVTFEGLNQAKIEEAELLHRERRRLPSCGRSRL